jgi:hypothetical protein
MKQHHGLHILPVSLLTVSEKLGVGRFDSGRGKFFRFTWKFERL